ncbi:hypothetical protein CK220_30985 [Mesorhizobium sp. WSM3860]|nr:hypothetical protein CK220_30985 [Mesorhizobium sp. WSM3860]
MVQIISEELSQQRDILRRLRPKFLEVLVGDDQLKGFVSLLEQDARMKVQAREILLNAAARSKDLNLPTSGGFGPGFFCNRECVMWGLGELG